MLARHAGPGVGDLMAIPCKSSCLRLVRRLGGAGVLLAACLLVSTTALADEGDPVLPPPGAGALPAEHPSESDSPLTIPDPLLGGDTPLPDLPLEREVDRRLREALEREYGPLGIDPQDATAPVPIPDEYYEIDIPVDAEPFLETLGVRVALWAPEIKYLQVRKQEDGDGTSMDLADLGNLVDKQTIPRYGMFLHLAEWFTLDVDFYQARFSSGEAEADTIDIFAGELIDEGDLLKARIELQVVDTDMRFHIVDEDGLQLGLSMGFLYLRSRTRLELDDGTELSNQLEGVIPYVGAYLALRPSEGFELFASGKIGAVELEDDPSADDDGASVDDEFGPDSRDHEYAELSVGARYLIGESLGISVSWEWQVMVIERVHDDNEQLFDVGLHGVQVAAWLKF